MGGAVRDKHIRTNRRIRSVKPETDQCCLFESASISKSILESGIKPLNHHLTPNELIQTAGSNPNPSPNSHFDDSGWGYCTEEQLEAFLLKNLEFLYNEAISKLVALGYDEQVALEAILRSGHCYGGMDVLTNILHNSLTYLNNSCVTGNGNSNESVPVFADLRQLQEYSLAGMVCLLQQIRPHLSKGDAMWCLLMSDLHVGRASNMEVSLLPSSGNSGSPGSSSVEIVSNSNQSVGVMAPALCRFHSGWGFGNGGGSEFPVHGFCSYGAEVTWQREIECPKRFNLSPSMKSLLKKNVAMFAAGFRANSKHSQPQNQTLLSTLSAGDSPVGLGAEVAVDQCEESRNSKTQEAINLVLSKFRDLNLDENMEFVADDQKDEVIVALLHQIKELERQLKERKDWAHQKAMQAARKLSNDLTELKMLRMEREETQRLKKGKQTLEDATMKRLSEMENALRKASGQVDRANAAVRRLETENAEIRAEMEASKLSAAESVAACLDFAKREKKCLKKLLAWEKQKDRLQEETAEEKLKLQQNFDQIKQGRKDAEVKWRQVAKAKDLALRQVEEEKRLKEAAEANNKRKLETLRLKYEIDSQRHKDDLQRLEQERSNLTASAQSTELQQPNASPTVNAEGAKHQAETIAKLLCDLEGSSVKESSDRECIICKKDEVSIVFLPCTHEVMCANCNDDFVKKGKATCPCCRVAVEQRIRVFGASS